ncbi:hypothetical protein L915_20916 [Phytophthora nicotianae]|uniref:Uncharacterized protein n=1 Tax=Phytophthora nicotianae TaxID=4792 RepID=W2HVZ8_PHYNI|nr:hypothetical protein L915_20916 [Phytophthora nicotianae]ETL25333.1 hypothetical protein L916_20799 [Phytophthora nicotianae]
MVPFSSCDRVETLACEQLVADGIVNSNKLVTLRLALYRPMCNVIDGCFTALKPHLKPHLWVSCARCLSLAAYRILLMKEAVETSRHIEMQRLIWRMELPCLNTQ